MKIHALPGKIAVEAMDADLFISSEGDVIRLFEELFQEGACALILRKEQFAEEFFDLRSGLAGAVLQKFSNYHVQMAIVGDFSQMTSKSLNAFIYESNQGNQIFFVDGVEVALQKLGAPARR